jgi:hypothetical protein
MMEENIGDDAWERMAHSLKDNPDKYKLAPWLWKNWRRPQIVGSLDRDELFGCGYDAVARKDRAAQSTLSAVVREHPGRIHWHIREALAIHAVCNDDPEVRSYAKQQILDVLKARGAAEPDLIEAVLDRCRATAQSKTPVFKEAAEALQKEVESMFPGSAAPTTTRQRVRSLLHLTQ